MNKKKACIVLLGATSAEGIRTARALAQQQKKVILVDEDRESLTQILEDLRPVSLSEQFSAIHIEPHNSEHLNWAISILEHCHGEPSEIYNCANDSDSRFAALEELLAETFGKRERAN